jgi:hypothetical protein
MEARRRLWGRPAAEQRPALQSAAVLETCAYDASPRVKRRGAPARVEGGRPYARCAMPLPLSNMSLCSTVVTSFACCAWASLLRARALPSARST